MHFYFEIIQIFTFPALECVFITRHGDNSHGWNLKLLAALWIDVLLLVDMLHCKFKHENQSKTLEWHRYTKQPLGIVQIKNMQSKLILFNVS